MQATDATTQVARALFGVLSHIMRSTSPEFFRTLDQHGVTLTQVKLLHVLRGEDDLSVKGLSECVGLSLAATSRAVEDLVARDLADRQEDPADRRMKRVRITRAGEELIATLHRMRLAALEEWAASLPADERDALAAALEPIAARSPDQ